ncbi:hypothetical protein ARMGADRAFT_28819 [Armillaria gallica]|uniref:Uncharacterized protein n=1 Tax=Armillaria gallica TaxID=47427 RepID=A0A2H3EM61_ARMGA|nr:hypothetical protein ARMGADRAFT_28819 [Armillaria gallica]
MEWIFSLKGLRGCQNITSTQYFFKGWSIRPTDRRGNNIPDQGTTYGIGKRTATRLAAVTGCSRSLPAGPCRNAKSASSASSNDYPFIICITEMMFNRITEPIFSCRKKLIWYFFLRPLEGDRPTDRVYRLDGPVTPCFLSLCQLETPKKRTSSTTAPSNKTRMQYRLRRGVKGCYP